MTRTGDPVELDQVQVDATTISGNCSWGERQEFPLREVEVFEGRKFSVVKTVALVVLVAPVVYGGLLAIALAGYMGG